MPQSSKSARDILCMTLRKFNHYYLTTLEIPRVIDIAMKIPCSIHVAFAIAVGFRDREEKEEEDEEEAEENQYCAEELHFPRLHREAPLFDITETASGRL